MIKPEICHIQLCGFGHTNVWFHPLILVDLHKTDKPNRVIIEVEPYTLKPAIIELLDEYINHQDFHNVDSPVAERLAIIVNNPILFSELVFKYPELKQLT